MLELTLRLVFSLAAVVGLMLLLARFAGRRFRGQAGSALQVLHRQALSRSASVVVVSVGSRVLVLGTTDQQVRVLTELDPDELPGADLALVEGHLDELELDRAELDLPVSAVPSLPARRADAPALTAVSRRGPGAHRAQAAPPRAGRADGPLAGSVLSVQTWRQAFAAATRRAS